VMKNCDPMKAATIRMPAAANQIGLKELLLRLATLLSIAGRPGLQSETREAPPNHVFKTSTSETRGDLLLDSHGMP